MKKKVLIGDIDNGMWKPVGFHKVTNSASVVPLAPTDGIGPTGGAILANTVRFCTLQAETTIARYTDVTGATPSTAIGMILHPGIAPMIYGSSPSNILLWVTAGNVNVNYYK